MINDNIRRSVLCMAFVVVTGSSSAHAMDGAFYIGLDAGKAEARKYCGNIGNCDSSDASLRGEVGYQINSNFAAELGYTSFGTLFDANDVNVNARQKASAWTLSALAAFPFAERFSIFGRLGVATYSTDNSGTVQGVAVEDKMTTKPYIGAGLGFEFYTNWLARAEYQIYNNISGVDGTKDNVNAWYVGGAYKF